MNRGCCPQNGHGSNFTLVIILSRHFSVFGLSHRPGRPGRRAIDGAGYFRESAVARIAPSQ